MKNSVEEGLVEYRIEGTFPLGKPLILGDDVFIITSHSGQKVIADTGKYSVMVRVINHQQ